jgi:hypothetical protein
VGPDRLVVMGRACDRPHGFISPKSLISGLARLAGEGIGQPGVTSGLDVTRLLGILGGEPSP